MIGRYQSTAPISIQQAITDNHYIKPGFSTAFSCTSFSYVVMLDESE